MKRILPELLAVFIILSATCSAAWELRITADKLSLQADQVPLQEILKQLVGSGIRVRIDPQINPTLSAAFNDREMQAALDSILKSLNYVLVWESIPGPGGALPLLAEIQIFKPGRQEHMLLLAPGSALSLAMDPKGSHYVKNELLIKLKTGLSLPEFRKLLVEIGGRVTDYDAATGVYLVRLPDHSDVPAAVERISNHLGIAGAEPNYAYPVFNPYPDPSPSLPIPDFPRVSGPQGAAPIAVIDTGLLPGTGLERLILATLDTLNPGKQISDIQGHGTQMALIAAGVIRPFGAKDDDAYLAPLIAIRAFDDNGFTSGFQLMQGIEFAIRNGARVLSLSWGADTRSEFLEDALADAASKGLIVVASAGNEPTGRPVYPAAYPSVIAVGALEPDGKIWGQSNFGRFVSLYAPGFASLPVGYRGEPGSYAGTSIAAAFAANRIADYLAKHPAADIQEIFNALRTQRAR